MEEVVTLQLEAPLALVTLNRPKSLNALNSEVYRQLIAILRRVEGMDTIKAVILTGAGDKAFAAGADIAQMVHEDSMAARRLSGLCHEAAGLLENMRQVTIAAVNGYALGGGCELTLACDIRIAAEQARFALPEVTLGIIPGGGGTQRLARLIGAGRAKEMIFTGDQIDAQEAWRIGLVNHVVPKEDLLEACRTLGKKIASRASYAVYLAKTAINSSQEIDLAGIDGPEERRPAGDGSDGPGLCHPRQTGGDGSIFGPAPPGISGLLTRGLTKCTIGNPLCRKGFPVFFSAMA